MEASCHATTRASVTKVTHQHARSRSLPDRRALQRSARCPIRGARPGSDPFTQRRLGLTLRRRYNPVSISAGPSEYRARRGKRDLTAEAGLQTPQRGFGTQVRKSRDDFHCPVGKPTLAGARVGGLAQRVAECLHQLILCRIWIGRALNHNRWRSRKFDQRAFLARRLRPDRKAVVARIGRGDRRAYERRDSQGLHEPSQRAW